MSDRFVYFGTIWAKNSRIPCKFLLPGRSIERSVAVNGSNSPDYFDFFRVGLGYYCIRLCKQINRGGGPRIDRGPLGKNAFAIEK